jgi:putative FmdB family regulatory protein
MPTYEYECSNCGHALEALQTMTEPKLVKCPKCKKNKLVRLIGSGSGVIFKGSGFYETDYKRKSPSKSDKTADSSHSCASGNCPHKVSGACGGS